MAPPARTKAEGEGMHQTIMLHAVVLAIPRTPKERVDLEEDLRQIDCFLLMKKPWNLKNKGMVRELIIGVPNQFNLTIREKLENWTTTRWRETYDFKEEGDLMAFRMDKFIGGKF